LSFVDDWQADRGRLPRSIAGNYEICLGSLLDVRRRRFGNGEATPGPSHVVMSDRSFCEFQRHISQPFEGGNEKSSAQANLKPREILRVEI